jgi:uncharacterized protein YjgD (DUF1641 family)
MTITDVPTDRLDVLEAKIDRLTDQLSALTSLGMVSELVADVTQLGPDVMASVVDRLDEVDRRGYFRFASAAAGVADRVVTNFDEHDVEQLGDNVVAMLEALREVTQPEMLAFLSRMIGAVHTEQEAIGWEPADPPSLWALARQMRDPDVRRGMARALHTLRSVAVETGPHAGGRTATPSRPDTTQRSTPQRSTPPHETEGDVT